VGKQRPSTVVLAILLLLPLAAAPARAFDVRRHAMLTLSALRDELAGYAMLATLHGDIYPDVAGCALHSYCEGFHAGLAVACRGILRGASNPDEATITDLSGDHFDNDQLGMGRMRASYRIAKARRVLLEVSNPPADARELARAAGALVVFGAALHGVQDFYSHSSYVECNRGLIQGSGLERVAPWDGDLQLACGEVPLAGGGSLTGLHTGFFLRDPGAGQTTHARLNKDVPDSAQGALALRDGEHPRTHYAAASGQFDAVAITDAYAEPGLAVRHTRRALDSLLHGTPLYDTLELPIVLSSRLDLIGMRGGEDEAAHVRGVVDAVADDPRMEPLLRDVLSPAFAVCAVGETLAEIFQRLLPAAGR